MLNPANLVDRTTATMARPAIYQLSHITLGVDLEKMAGGAGIRRTLTVERVSEIAEGARLIRECNATADLGTLQRIGSWGRLFCSRERFQFPYASGREK